MLTESRERKREHLSPWIPLSMLAITTAAIALPLALLRRQHRAGASLVSRTTSSQSTSAPPIRRSPLRDVPSVFPPPPRIATSSTLQTPPTSTTGMASAKAASLLRRSSEVPLRVTREDSFNGALYSLKAFGFATALVITGAAASLWGVKAYLGVKDTHEFAAAMRLTLLTKWPLLTSRIYRPSDDSTLLPSPLSASSSLSVATAPATSEAPADEPPLKTAAVPDDVDGWNWPAAQARLAAAYEHGGVAQFAEAAVGELEAEWELERRKRGLGSSSEGQS